MFGEYGDINQDKLKVFYDAEFTGLHRDTTLISIGLVAEGGSYFYAEFTDYDKSQVNDWLQENVINNLLFNDKNDNHCINFPTHSRSTNDGEFKLYNVHIKSTKEIIGSTLLIWLYNISQYHNKQIQVYCDCYAYDWMLFNDLICGNGNALSIPSYIYYIPMDLSTAMQMKDIDPDITREKFISFQYLEDIKQHDLFKNIGDACKHNSLWDAYICRECFEILRF